MDEMVSAAPHRPRRSLSTTVIAVLVLLAVPAIAVASHQFSDVPASSSFHDDIEVLANAGIATGCGDGKYCPTNSVRRDQMAGFLNRGLGSSAAATGGIPATEAATTYIATVDLQAGAVSGGTVYVAVDADVTAIDTSGQCPCIVVVGLANVDAAESAPALTIFAVSSEMVDGGTASTGSAHWVFEVPSGLTGTYGVYADVFTETAEPLSTTGIGGDDPFLLGTIVAQYTPFGSTEPADPPSKKFEVPADWAGKMSDAVRVPRN